MVIPKKPNTSGVNTRILNPGNLPIVRSGYWHTLPPYGAAGSSSVPDARLFAAPMWPGRRCAITGCAVEMTAPIPGALVRIGLYTSANGLPGQLLADYGTVATSPAGIKTITNFVTHIEPDLYFLTIVRQGGLPALGMTTRDTWDPLVSETTPVLNANLNAYYIDGVSGALPASFGPPDGTIQGPSSSIQLT